MTLRRFFRWILSLSILPLPALGWMDESFIPVWEDSYRIQEPVSGDRITNSLGMTFIKIPAGKFWMGSPSNEPGRFRNEQRHRVRIPKDFYIMTTEVTQEQWERVMGSNPSRFTNCGKDCPVEMVSWNDVQEFINKLNAMDNSISVRLPTEAEWEYAARAGTKTALYSGPIKILGQRNAPALDPVAWYGGNSCVTYAQAYDCSGWTETQQSCQTCGPHPVGQKQPNAWGLYDMLGNVWEWVEDIYTEDYKTLPETTPVYMPATGVRRVLRGGGWNNTALSCRSANRIMGGPDNRDDFLGFRLAGS